MMSHLEGPIVQALYDTGIISFASAMTPALPLVAEPATPKSLRGFGFHEENPWLIDIPVTRGAKTARELFQAMHGEQQHGADGRLLPENGKWKDLVRVMIEKEAQEPPPPKRGDSWFEGMVGSVSASRAPSRSVSRRNSYEGSSTTSSRRSQSLIPLPFS
jgi:hypothetical protein